MAGREAGESSAALWRRVGATIGRSISGAQQHWAMMKGARCGARGSGVRAALRVSKERALFVHTSFTGDAPRVGPSLSRGGAGAAAGEIAPSMRRRSRRDGSSSCPGRARARAHIVAAARQVALSVGWLRVGYVQGNMNSDNCLLSGRTMDYGPCAPRRRPRTARPALPRRALGGARAARAREAGPARRARARRPSARDARACRGAGSASSSATSLSGRPSRPIRSASLGLSGSRSPRR